MKSSISYLSMVHEVENGLELSFLNAFQVEEWVFPVGVVGKNPPEEGRARGQYHFVGSDLETPIPDSVTFSIEIGAIFKVIDDVK